MEMKKLLSLFGALMITSLILTSCGGGSIESDAKKIANLACKTIALGEKVASGDASAAEELEKVEAEGKSLSEELEKKYSTKEEKEKFEKAVMEEIGKCK